MNLSIGVPILWSYVHWKFWKAYEEMKKPKEYVLQIVTGTTISVARNRLVNFGRNADYLLFLDSVTGDTPILIRRFGKFIDYIEIQEMYGKNNTGRYYECPKSIEVMTHHGWSNIKYIYKHPVRKKIYTLSGDCFAKITEDHCLYNCGDLISAKNLKIGDILDKSDFLDDNNHNLIKKEIAKLYGFFVAEGTTNKYVESYQWNISQNNLDILSFYSNIIESLYCIKTYIIKDKLCNKLTINNPKKLYDIYRNKFYTKSGMKKVPIEILNSTKEIIKEFLKGFYEGDGYYNKKCKDSVDYDTNSFILAAGLAYLNKKLGYKIRTYQRKDKLDIIKSNPIKIEKKYGIGKISTKDYHKIYVYDICTEDGTFVGGVNNIVYKNSDMVPPPNLIEELMNHNKDIVSALAYQKSYPHNPITFKLSRPGDYYRAKPTGELIEVDAVGMACCLVKTDVFKKIKAPYFDFSPYEGGDPKIEFYGEDISFCRKCKKAGYKIFIDTDLEVGHISDRIITGLDWVPPRVKHFEDQ